MTTEPEAMTGHEYCRHQLRSQLEQNARLLAENARLTSHAGTDAYRVRVWSSRKFLLLGRWGWRVQVDSISDWDEYGDEPMLPGLARIGIMPWLRTQDDAVAYGTETARVSHAQDRDGTHLLPLVVYAGSPVPVIDERPVRDLPQEGIL